jgi:cyclase
MPRVDLIGKLSDECFMPLAYGGGIKTVPDIKDLLGTGVEKVVINTHAVEDPSFVRKASDVFGSQSIVVSIDARRHADGRYEVFTHGGAKPAGLDPVAHARRIEALGAGEIFINSIDRDGTMQGYDLELVRRVADAVGIPVIACGGAGNLEHFTMAIRAGASAVAAGSIFVFHGRRRAVLINYPTRDEIRDTVRTLAEAAMAPGK